MSVKTEKLEKSMARLTIEVEAEKFDAAVRGVYQKMRGRIQIPGFRKGRAPQSLIEKTYGPGIFYEDAVNELLPDAYDKAAAECGLEIVSRPDIEVTQVGKGQNLVFTATVAIKPEVTLGEYKGLTYDEPEPIEVTDEEIEEELKKEQERQASLEPVEGRAAEEGDTVTIDFEGFVDGEAFEGGKGVNYELVLGSHSFIDTFEEQLVGTNIGDEPEVHVTFPEDYNAENLAGKPAVFQVKVKDIRVKVLPEIDDEFASEVTDVETLEEYRAVLKEELFAKKKQEAETQKENSLVEKAVENAQIEIPDPMVEEQARQQVNLFATRIRQQGMSFEQYCEFTGMDAGTLAEQMKPQALKEIRNRLVLEAVAEAEHIVITEEELDKELEKMAENYKVDIEKAREILGEKGLDEIRSDLGVKKAIKLIVDSAV